jgi:hypothetical protein
MSRFSKDIAQYWCGAIIAAPLIAFLLGVRVEGIENRRLPEIPDLSLIALLEEGGFSRFDAALRDRMPGRLQAVAAAAFIDYWLFRDSPSPEVTRGKEDWLFLTHTLHAWPCDEQSEPSINMESYRAFARAVASAGKAPLVVLSPGKVSIYPEYLFDLERDWYEGCAGPRSRQLEAYIDREEGIGLNLWRPLRTEKAVLLKRTAQDWQEERLRYLFRPRDRHWATQAGRLQAASLLSRVSTAPQRLLPDRDVITHRESELSRIYLKLGLMEAYRAHPNRRALVRRSGPNDFLIYRNEQPSDPKHVVVLRDSFFNDSVEFVADHFARSDFIHWKLGPEWPAGVRESLAQADIVVLQTAESRRHKRLASTKAIAELLQSL